MYSGHRGVTRCEEAVKGVSGDAEFKLASLCRKVIDVTIRVRERFLFKTEMGSEPVSQV
jgi:hypothetical protein